MGSEAQDPAAHDTRPSASPFDDRTGNPLQALTPPSRSRPAAATCRTAATDAVPRDRQRESSHSREGSMPDSKVDDRSITHEFDEAIQRAIRVSAWASSTALVPTLGLLT